MAEIKQDFGNKDLEIFEFVVKRKIISILPKGFDADIINASSSWKREAMTFVDEELPDNRLKEGDFIGAKIWKLSRKEVEEELEKIRPQNEKK